MAWPPPNPYMGMPPMGMPPMGMPPGGMYRGPPPMPYMRPPMMAPPGSMMPGMQPPSTLPPPPRAPAAPAAAPQKQLQAYVGKIPDSVPDGFIKNLLEQCGTVAKWERVTDPTSGKPKPFGFCKFVGADSVLRALRLLNGIEFDGGALLLKVDQKTQAYLDEYEAEQRLASAGSDNAEQQSAETAKDDGALKTIQELIANRAATVSATPSSDREDKDKDLRDREAERQEREAAREKEREERRKRDEDKQFTDRERDWERREADRLRDRERDTDREAAREKEREKRVAECLDVEEVEFDVWWNKHQDRMHQRRRVREREAEDDDLDRRKEREEQEAAEAQAAKERAERGEPEGNEDGDGDEDGQKEPMKLSFGLGASGKRKSSVFEDDKEVNKKMKLIPIEYTEEEQKAREVLVQEAQPQKTPEEKEAEMKRLIATIPIAKEDLLTYEVNWAIVDKGQLVESKMKPWVSKKIADYLGEEEPMLIKYVMEMLTEHAKASSIIEKLAVVLEDEAETFVIKLWRYLIFESMRSQAGL